MASKGLNFSQVLSKFSTVKISNLLKILKNLPEIQEQNFYFFCTENCNFNYLAACEEEWRRLAASAAAETRLLSPGMQPMPNQIRATQGTPFGGFLGTQDFFFNEL